VKKSDDSIFSVELRKELKEDYCVFYVTAWGYAADHLLGWFPKALNCHRDVFVLLAHEGSRPKYLTERTRGERPPLVQFTEFLNDMGMTYSAIGDCYSYRASQMPQLRKIDRYRSIPVVNLVRHPVAWLEFYIRWRASNMRMREGAMDPLLWEWKTTCHPYFKYLGLPSYSKDDIEVWTCYQGMFQLNNILSDIKAVKQHVQIEKVVEDPELFNKIVAYLSHGEVIFNQEDITRAYSMRDTLFRGESLLVSSSDRLLGSWPGWKVDAFRKILSQEAIDAYLSFGYDLKDLPKKSMSSVPDTGKVNRPVFVSSLMKSGTWLIREIIEMMTGFKPYEPEIGVGSPEYGNEYLIEFKSGTFFSWHTVVNSRVKSLLRGCQSKNIFLIRNIYDVILSMFNHLLNDVDASIGRSVIGNDYFDKLPIEQCLSLIISGFTSPNMTWQGLGPTIKQMNSMTEFAESGHALLITYEELVNKKPETLHRIMNTLGISLKRKQLDNILKLTDKDIMRERKKELNMDKHITMENDKLTREDFLPYHIDMVNFMIMKEAPYLPNFLNRLKLGNIISHFAISKDETKSINHKIDIKELFPNAQTELLKEKSFPRPKQMLLNGRITGKVISINMELLPKNVTETQTVLDFDHDVSSGCALQLDSGATSDKATVAWICSGQAITKEVKIGRWNRIKVRFGLEDMVAAMQIQDEAIKSQLIDKHPFISFERLLAVGYWLNGVRKFKGQIKNFRISGFEIL